MYAWRGDADQAFLWLDRAYAQRDDNLSDVKVDALLGRIRRDPRYATLLARLNLPH